MLQSFLSHKFGFSTHHVFVFYSLINKTLLTFTIYFERTFIKNGYFVTFTCGVQGSPVQEERNGPLPPPKPQEPSSNHTAPVPGERRGLQIPEYIFS